MVVATAITFAIIDMIKGKALPEVEQVFHHKPKQSTLDAPQVVLQ